MREFSPYSRLHSPHTLKLTLDGSYSPVGPPDCARPDDRRHCVRPSCSHAGASTLLTAALTPLCARPASLSTLSVSPSFVSSPPVQPQEVQHQLNPCPLFPSDRVRLQRAQQGYLDRASALTSPHPSPFPALTDKHNTSQQQYNAGLGLLPHPSASDSRLRSGPPLLRDEMGVHCRRCSFRTGLSRLRRRQLGQRPNFRTRVRWSRSGWNLCQ